MSSPDARRFDLKLLSRLAGVVAMAGLTAGCFQPLYGDKSIDINSGRPDIQNYGIYANYTLTDLSTGKKVVTGQTFSRVSYNIPGQQQRFAGDRGLRDAEDRAAKVIADNVRNRLASYFVAGT
jgi:hypothetical protein